MVISRRAREAITAGFIEGVNRDQTTLFPERLEGWIREDHPVRAAGLIVEDLDLAALGFSRPLQHEPGGRGLIRLCCSSSSSTAA